MASTPRAGPAASSVGGFLEEQDIPSNSHTETFAAIKLEIDTRRWAGVPFYLRTGKRLGRRVTEVAVVFKRAPHLPFNETATEELGQNALVIRVQPDEGVTLRFGSKVPGTAMEIRDVNMDFAYGGAFVESSPEAYERLILDVLLGDPPLFPQHEEVELSWQILDPILEHWAAAGKARTVRVGHLGSAVRRRDAGARRPRCGVAREEHGMSIELTSTNASTIASALLQERRKAGSPAMGMVLTLVVVTDEGSHYDAIKAAKAVSREHPSRILGVIRRSARGAANLDAEVRIGDGGSGETVLLRMSGPLAKHPESVVLPLLLPDSPVVVWWPSKAPDDPATDPLGRLAKRRITDTAAIERGRAAAMLTQATNYSPGNTDLSWTRLTPWRALLAAALDQYPTKVKSGVVAAERVNPSADLLAAWLSDRLKVKVERIQSKGPGITTVALHDQRRRHRDHPAGRAAGGVLDPQRPDASGGAEARELAELLAEELRRLDPDDVYAETVRALCRINDKAASEARGLETAHARVRPQTGRTRAGSRQGDTQADQGQSCSEEGSRQEGPRSRRQEGRHRDCEEEGQEGAPDGGLHRPRPPHAGRARRGGLRPADHHPGRHPGIRPGAVVGADGRHHRRPDPCRRGRIAGARRRRLVARRPLVGRRAVPARGTRRSQRDPGPQRRCSTSCASTRTACT